MSSLSSSAPETPAALTPPYQHPASQTRTPSPPVEPKIIQPSDTSVNRFLEKMLGLFHRKELFIRKAPRF
jgi:hypothetical protein